MEANENKQTRKEMFIRKTRQDKTEQENNKQKMKRKQCKDRERYTFLELLLHCM